MGAEIVIELFNDREEFLKVSESTEIPERGDILEDSELGSLEVVDVAEHPTKSEVYVFVI
jgi:hypothetical protein